MEYWKKAGEEVKNVVKEMGLEDVWETDVARDGINIWLATMAMANKAKIGQVSQEVKNHDMNEPIEVLDPMFRQIVTTMFLLMEENESIWKSVKGSQAVPVIGPINKINPEPYEIDIDDLIDRFKIGYKNWKEIWQKIMTPNNWDIIAKLYKKESLITAINMKYKNNTLFYFCQVDKVNWHNQPRYSFRPYSGTKNSRRLSYAQRHN